MNTELARAGKQRYIDNQVNKLFSFLITEFSESKRKHVLCVSIELIAIEC